MAEPHQNRDEGRPSTSTSPYGATTTYAVVQMQYAPCGCSPMGKLSQQSRPYKPGDPVYWTIYSYDGLGRTVAVFGPRRRPPDDSR